MAALARSGKLDNVTPVRTGADGIAARPNERFVSVQGDINGVPNTLLTAVAERDDAKAPWKLTYTIGAGASQTRIEQTPIDGQPGRYLTTIGPLHPDINNGAAWPTSTSDTGPLVLKTEGSSVMAVIDGHAVFPTGR